MITSKIEETDEKSTLEPNLLDCCSKTSLMKFLDKIKSPHVKSKINVSNSDIAKYYLKLLCQINSDF